MTLLTGEMSGVPCFEIWKYPVSVSSAIRKAGRKIWPKYPFKGCGRLNESSFLFHYNGDMKETWKKIKRKLPYIGIAVGLFILAWFPLTNYFYQKRVNEILSQLQDNVDQKEDTQVTALLENAKAYNQKLSGHVPEIAEDQILPYHKQLSIDGQENTPLARSLFPKSMSTCRFTIPPAMKSLRWAQAMSKIPVCRLAAITLILRYPRIAA